MFTSFVRASVKLRSESSGAARAQDEWWTPNGMKMALLRKTKTSFLFKLTCYVWCQCSFCWIIIFNTIYSNKPLLFSVDLLHFLMLFIRRGWNFAWSLSSKTRVCFGANAWELMSTDYSCCAHMHRELKITCKICRCTAEHQRAGHGNIGPID